MRLLLVDPNLRLEDLRTVGGAISLRLIDASAIDRVWGLAVSNDWVCTRADGRTVAIEPRVPELVPNPSAVSFYHVSDAVDRSRILQEGLTLQNGGNTSLNRFYTGRVHLAVRMRDAFQFLHHQLNRPSGTIGSGQRVRKFDELDLYRVTVPPDAELYRDHHFDGHGVWVARAIPPCNLCLTPPDSWHELYRQLYPEDFEEADYSAYLTEEF